MQTIDGPERPETFDIQKFKLKCAVNTINRACLEILKAEPNWHEATTRGEYRELLQALFDCQNAAQKLCERGDGCADN